jgi:uncharacterized membrane protein YoaK (UPF0700 family)
MPNGPRLATPNRRSETLPVQPLAFAALAVITVLSFVLFVLGRRFMHAYYEKHHLMPPMTWMFHATGDPELERPRRLALALLPIYLLALVLYLFRP